MRSSVKTRHTYDNYVELLVLITLISTLLHPYIHTHTDTHTHAHINTQKHTVVWEELPKLLQRFVSTVYLLRIVRSRRWWRDGSCFFAKTISWFGVEFWNKNTLFVVVLENRSRRVTHYYVVEDWNPLKTLERIKYIYSTFPSNETKWFLVTANS